jgi:catechol 2,3-dioxygenase-like lactoylglutathione lyase family enzyme
MKVRRLQHVSSPFTDGGQAALRTFYGELLGLSEIPTPSTLSNLELVWFSAGGGGELHFFRGAADPAAARHFCLDVEGLDETRRRLSVAGYEPYDDTPIPNRPRFFCRDPAGNLVEFTSVEGSGDPVAPAGRISC